MFHVKRERKSRKRLGHVHTRNVQRFLYRASTTYSKRLLELAYWFETGITTNVQKGKARMDTAELSIHAKNQGVVASSARAMKKKRISLTLD
jgi:hypothetical protein